MKKIFLLSFALLITIHTQLSAQCGVTSGFQLQASIIDFGSNLVSDHSIDPGWNVYAYRWERNGALAGTTQSIYNEGIGFDNVCLTVKATNPVTNDSCESTYCQLVYTIYPSLFSLFIEAVPAGPLTIQFYGGICSSYSSFGADFTWDFGDGNTGALNSVSHTYADTGTYEVTLFYQDLMVSISGDVKRKVYVDNGNVNYSVTSFLGSSNCTTVNSAFNSIPSFTSGYATPVDFSPLSYTTYVQAQPGISFPMQYYGTGIDIIQYYAGDALGNSIGTCRKVVIPDCKIAPDTVSGIIWLDDDADGLFDPGETVYTGNAQIRIDYGQYHVSPDASGNYSLPVPPLPVSVQITGLPSGYVVTYPSTNGHYSFFNTSTNHPGFNFGVVNTNVNICGKAYIDINNNGVFNSGVDLNYTGVMVTAFNATLNRTFSVTSDQSGNYCVKVPVGNYVIKAHSNLLDSAFSVPDSVIINAPSAGYFNNNDFGFQTSVQGGNLGVVVSPGGMSRPGFNYSLRARVTNTGIETSAGTVVINYHPDLVFVNATSGAIHNAVNKTVTWNTGVMNPATAKIYAANFTVPIPTPLGTVLSSNATVSTGATYSDYDNTNNFSVCNSVVVGSYDPNDKLVSPAGIGSGGNVLHGQRLYYRINFQNVGTASAINIIVQDEINANLNMNTFVMERASHNYTMSITGNTVTWKFFNIHLPDSNTNEPQSHGFIEFSIKAKPGLPDGTIVENHADIYFDFNPPIITNSVINTLQTTLTGIGEMVADANFVVFPNPFGDEVTVKQINSDEKINVILVFDIYGKMVAHITGVEIDNGVHTLNFKNASSGVYIIKIEFEYGIAYKKVMRL